MIPMFRPILFTALLIALPSFSYAQETATAEALSPSETPPTETAKAIDKLDLFIDKPITIKLDSKKDDNQYADVTLLRIDRHRKTGEAVKLRILIGDDKQRTVSLRKVTSIVTSTDEGEETIFRPAADDGKRKRMTRKERAEAVAKAQRDRWLGILAANGKKPWPVLSPQEHQAAVNKHKERYAQVRALLPDLQLVETKHFLFCTNISPKEIGKYVAALDRMYEWMQQAYGVDPSRPIWRGKASIFAFKTKEQFVAFERQFFKNNPAEGTAGLCHQDSQRNICIAVHQGNDLDYFGLVLVHETSHGFIHCYRTPVRVPSWVNEGMAEVIASMMVPQSKGVQRKEKGFVDSMKKSPQPSLGRQFFTVDGNIPFDRYGGASSMTRFLIETDKTNYVHFVDLMKAGMDWQQALRLSYNAGPNELVRSYGAWIGVPNLMP